MAQPTIEVLGVYSIPVTKELLREQTDILYGTDLAADERRDAEFQCREQLESTVLVEVLVRDRDQRFGVGDFCQPQEGVPRSSWQVAWAEAFLSEDGERLIVERWSNAPEAGSFRVAFFIHLWKSSAPLMTSYGDLHCPEVKMMPERLQKLVPYEPVSRG
jgi:hypothetical protein